MAYPELFTGAPSAKAKLVSLLQRMGYPVALSEEERFASLPMESTGMPGAMGEEEAVKANYAKLAHWPLYDFARWDVAEVALKPGAIVAYEMGLGKTRFGLALAELLGGPVAIVAPARLMPQWERERTLVPLTVSVDLYTYEYIRMHEPDLRGYRAIIADEAHRLRNQETLTFASMQSLSPPRRYALTATPTGGSLRQLAGVLEWIGASAYLPRTLELYQDPRGIGLSQGRMLREALAPVLKVRQRNDPKVLVAIGEAYPPVSHTMLVPPTEELWRFYLLQVRNVDRWWQKQQGEARARRGLWRLLRASTYPESLGFTGPNPLWGAFASTLQEGDLVFVSHKDFGAKLAQELKVPFVHGGIPLQRRLQRVQAFRAGEYPMLVATFGTLAEGYDIPEAKRVVVAEPIFDAIAMIQAIGRLQRPGRKMPVVPVVRIALQDSAAHYALVLTDAKLATLEAIKRGEDLDRAWPTHGHMLYELLAMYAQ